MWGWSYKNPLWLHFVTNPVLNGVFNLSLFGKTIDEWLANAPLLTNYAFRHLVVCRKK
jgi:hypothetical protein